jgi:hypothetical protein
MGFFCILVCHLLVAPVASHVSSSIANQSTALESFS